MNTKSNKYGLIIGVLCVAGMLSTHSMSVWASQDMFDEINQSFSHDEVKPIENQVHQ